MQCVFEYTHCCFCSVWPWCVGTGGKMIYVEPTEEILNFSGLECHICTNRKRSAVERIHPFHQTLDCLVTTFCPRSKSGDKRRGAVNNNENSVCFNQDFDICMVNKKARSPKLSERRPDIVLLCRGGFFILNCSQPGNTSLY